nr:S49 family peptidase [Gammaproteobacteria bacterium]
MAQVKDAAKGRVWTGSDAQAEGLVNELGGFPTALRIARQMAGLAPDAPIRLKLFPEEKSSFRRLLEGKPASSEDEILEAVLYKSLSALQPALDVLREAELLSPAHAPTPFHACPRTTQLSAPGRFWGVLGSRRTLGACGRAKVPGAISKCAC